MILVIRSIYNNFKRGFSIVMKRKKIVKMHRRLFLVGIIIFLILGGVSFWCLENKQNNHVQKEKTQENLILEIMKKVNDPDVDEDFLQWIEKEYKHEVIVKLSKYLKNNNYDKKVWHKFTNNSLLVLQDLYNDRYSDAKDVRQINVDGSDITLSFVGDVSLADNWYIMPEYDRRGKKVYGILSEEIVQIMNKSDVMVANSEFTVSDRGKKMAGKYYTFRASPKRLSIYSEMGVDLVTLANNHVYDFGKDAFYDMLDAFSEYNIPYVGAGRNIEEARRPYYFVVGGYKIAFVNATRAEKFILTPEATISEGGVFRCYDPSEFAAQIKEAHRQSDYVVALVHWGLEDSHELEDVQRDTSKVYIDAGADVIVGTHAHTLQGIEYYKNKPIIYNLGDFIFNNETKDTGIFQIKISRDGDVSYYFLPCLEDREYTYLLNGSDAFRVISDINSWSINAKIDEDGKISESA